MGDGRWRPSAAALAEVLDVPARICSARRSETLALRDSHGECYITEIGLLK